MIQRDSKQIWNEALGCLLCITVPTGLAVAAYFCGLKDAWPVCAVVILGLAYVGALQRVLQCALQVFGLTGTAFWRWRAVQGSASECSCADLCHFAILNFKVTTRLAAGIYDVCITTLFVCVMRDCEHYGGRNSPATSSERTWFLITSDSFWNTMSWVIVLLIEYLCFWQVVGGGQAVSMSWTGPQFLYIFIYAYAYISFFVRAALALRVYEQEPEECLWLCWTCTRKLGTAVEHWVAGC